jgi:tRNA 5-methylaminomethyl-2-thiouridine biosynthesis bifunctional protein
VLQLARDEKEDVSQRRSVAGLPPDYAQYATREEASAHAGVPVAAGGVWFPRAGWIQPRSLVDAQLKACGDRLTRVFGKEVASLEKEEVVILANSGEAPNLHPVPNLRLRRVRGQLTYVPEDRLEPPHVVVLRGGMVLPPVDGLCVVGASYDIDDEEARPSAESEAGNLQRLEHILGLRLKSSFENRVAFRSVTPDRLPVVGQIADNVYGAFAYGSRGLLWAGLAGELLASLIEGEPLPLEKKLVAALDPGRFALRAKRRATAARD